MIPPNGTQSVSALCYVSIELIYSKGITQLIQPRLNGTNFVPWLRVFIRSRNTSVSRRSQGEDAGRWIVEHFGRYLF